MGKSKISSWEDIYEANKENCSAASSRLVPQYLWDGKLGDISVNNHIPPIQSSLSP